MQADQRVILFAHPRSGSSSLFQILQLHPQLRILEEPFNEDFVRWSPENPDYLGAVHDLASLDRQLETIFSRYNGIKLLDYQLPDELLSTLLQRASYRIVFLRRRNLLQTVVSNLIAEQTNVWKMWDLTTPLADAYRGLDALDIAVVGRSVHELDAHLALCEALLRQRPAGTFLNLVYEDLYFAPPPAQLAQLAAVWQLLQLPPLESERLGYFLSPAEVKLNSNATYALLPNARAIHTQCGSDRTGWLFE